MQLILGIDVDIGIEKNMSSVKAIENDKADKSVKDILNIESIKKENLNNEDIEIKPQVTNKDHQNGNSENLLGQKDSNVAEETVENKNTAPSNDIKKEFIDSNETVLIKCENDEIESKDWKELQKKSYSINDNVSDINKNSTLSSDENQSLNTIKEEKSDETLVENNTSRDSIDDTDGEYLTNSQCETKSNIKNEKSPTSEVQEVIDSADEKDNIIDSADEKYNIIESFEEKDNVTESESLTENKSIEIKDPSDEQNGSSLENEEIIDIAEEKYSCDSINDKKIEEIVNLEELENNSSDNSVELETTSTKQKSEKEKVHTNTNSSSKPDESVVGFQSVEQNTISSDKPSNVTDGPSENTEQKSKSKYVSKLSLDILSDDEEEESPKPETPVLEPEPVDKQSINVEDDDDIMVIDDEASAKENKPDANVVEQPTSKHSTEVNQIQEISNNDSQEKEIEKMEVNNEGSIAPAADVNENKDEITKEDNTEKKSPLLTKKFLQTFKKNLADMTREELEEFCILKIVESVFDKSNLGEIKSQLKTMAQTIEEYKKKATMITKQNRDLQVVLKSVQEEQKKNTNGPITPLKITRSVGMQVLLTEKNPRKRPSLPNSMPPIGNMGVQNANNTNNKMQTRTNQNNRAQKPQQQIPVPRLIPAVTPKPNNVPPPNVNLFAKSPFANSTPNGVKIAPTPPKPEKRTHSKMVNSNVSNAQQNSNVTVDLTDDEPPSKVQNRAAPVRCVPPQTLLAPQRAQLTQPQVNSPRKVYIPISGPQNQNIRPGQTIMLKTLPSGPRIRGPAPNLKIGSNPSPVRMGRVNHRHPAPLPESTKQYQPPNWKALPPAPELKLSKVENGIVISWKIDGYIEEKYEEIASYQLYAYQETSSPPNTSLWKKIGDVKALPLPMACTLTQFMAGYKYYFAVRAVDVRSRLGPFSLPGSILLLNAL